MEKRLISVFSESMPSEDLGPTTATLAAAFLWNRGAIDCEPAIFAARLDAMSENEVLILKSPIETYTVAVARYES